MKLRKVIGIILIFLQLVAIYQGIKEGTINSMCNNGNGNQQEIYCFGETLGFYLMGIIGIILLIEKDK